MEIMKRFTVIILIFFLLILECILMGVFALDLGSGTRSVRDAITTSGIVSEMTEDALRAGTVNMGGAYGEKLEAVMESEAMTDFFTEYISTGIRSIVYGVSYEEIAVDEMLRAFDKGADQVNASGKYDITPDERNTLMMYMEQAAPDLTQSLDVTMKKYETTTAGGAGEAVSQARGVSMFAPILSPAFRTIMLVALAVIAAILLFLSDFRPKGLAWSGAATLAAGALYLMVGVRGAGGGTETVDVFLNVLVKDGAMAVSAAAIAAGLLLMAAAAVMAVRVRRSV